MVSKLPTKELQLGTRIDGGTLELVEVLGVGGYGVVYRAVHIQATDAMSYAVKCLAHNRHQPSERRQHHIREIALHQLSSAHPGVVTLHRVIEDDEYTYIIMEYAPDSDLFNQILNNSRYLGNSALIKHVFLQLIDAVGYCHSLGIYHRDLKPENVLCFENGSRVAITDFGLATTEKMSTEMRTGSIYHMSPECQGDEFSTGTYSPMFNDVWSLGIILLNLSTGRNPWKTATLSDETFCEYIRNPMQFFPSVLPISQEFNDILIRMLHVDYTERITLSELREELEEIECFYIRDVVFDGSQARCLWEVAPSSDHPQSDWSRDSQHVGDLHEASTPITHPSAWSSHYRDLGLEDGDDEGGGTKIRINVASSQLSSPNSSLYSDSPTTPDTVDASFANCFPRPVIIDDWNQWGFHVEALASLGPFAVDDDSEYRDLRNDGSWSSLMTSMALPEPERWVDPANGSERNGNLQFARNTTPSPYLVPWAHKPAVAAAPAPLADRPRRILKTKLTVLDSIKFLSSRSPGSRKDWKQKGNSEIETCETPRTSAKRARQHPNGGGAAQKALQDIQANDCRKISVKSWFSPSKLFS